MAVAAATRVKLAWAARTAVATLAKVISAGHLEADNDCPIIESRALIMRSMNVSKPPPLPVKFSLLLSRAEFVTLHALADHAKLSVDDYVRVLIRNKLRRLGESVLPEVVEDGNPLGHSLRRSDVQKTLESSALWKIDLPDGKKPARAPGKPSRTKKKAKPAKLAKVIPFRRKK
jgi:hypothetical protein